ncbi:hypothetical protein WBP07_22665 (plasmid) [Novosphingobium sp. BL-8A]|uniref:hypothetical protein n=1 Tax=Novosphingobium sp. BL-8A TaxID=3127639 RepID=UPI0037568A26
MNISKDVYVARLEAIEALQDAIDPTLPESVQAALRHFAVHAKSALEYGKLRPADAFIIEAGEVFEKYKISSWPVNALLADAAVDRVSIPGNLATPGIKRATRRNRIDARP